MTIAMHEQYYPAKGERGVVGRFDYAETPDPVASQKAGEVVAMKIPVLIAKAAGSEDYVTDKLPSDPIRRKMMTDRFPEAWLAFQGIMVEPPGTPLEQPFHDLPVITRGELARWQMYSVSTWEQIADLSDASCDALGLGTRNRRDQVMIAMGRTPPGKPPMNIVLSPHMTAEQAIMTLPNGAALVEAHKAKIAELTGETHDAIATGLPSVPGTGMVDLTAPEVQAAIQAAVAQALAKPPRAKRSHHKAKTEAPAE